MVGKPVDASFIQDKDVRKAVEKLVASGWTLRAEGHKARLYCPCEAKCTAIPVPGTPKNPGNAVRRIMHTAGRCPLPPHDPNRSLAGMDRD